MHFEADKSTMHMKSILKNILLLSLTLIIGCHSYNVRSDITGEERFALAKKMFENEDYRDAQTQFKIVVLNNPGVTFVDDAQYYLAECHFEMGEFIIAADEYNRLIRLYPNSEWVDDARFKIGLADFELSPKPSLDQKYTRRAIENLQRFIEDYPQSELVPKAERILQTCRRKLAEKEFKAGELYRKLSDCEAALVYFDSVINNYYDTRFVKNALYWKGECLLKQKKPSESFQVFSELVNKYPDSEFVGEAREKIREIESDIVNIREANGISDTNPKQD